MPEFSALETQNIREYWEDEARAFTPWIADEIADGGTSHLEDVLGLDLEVIGTEQQVGRYNLDVLARVVADDREVVIENQLTSSDHDHLGKSIAYAAGVDADIIVWVASEFHDEHVDAVQWLNTNSREGIDVFALQLEVVTIGDSDPAVRFSPFAQPSEWTEQAQRASDELSDTQSTYKQFWTAFRDELRDRRTPLSTRKPSPQHYYSNSIGAPGFHTSSEIRRNSDELACTLVIDDDADAFETLYAQRDEIEDELDTSLEWEPPEETSTGKERSLIRARREGDVFENGAGSEQWKEYREWFIETGERFHEVFGTRIQEL